MFFQENLFCPPPCSIRIAGRVGAAESRFHSSATRVMPPTPEYSTVWGLLLLTVLIVLTLPRWHSHCYEWPHEAAPSKNSLSTRKGRSGEFCNVQGIS